MGEKEKQVFKENMRRLISIEDEITDYECRLASAEEELARLDMKRHSAATLRDHVNLVAPVCAVQHVTEIICKKLMDLKAEKKEIYGTLQGLYPNGIAEYEIVYEEEEKQKINNENINYEVFKPTDQEIQAFSIVFPGEELDDLSKEIHIDKKELIEFSKDFIEYRNRHSKFQSEEIEQQK